METTQNVFHFGGRIPEFLISGLTLLTTRDFVLFSIGVVVITVFVECLQRVSRACQRRLLHGSHTAPTIGHELVLLPSHSDRGPLRSTGKQADGDGEKSPRPTAGNEQSVPLLGRDDHDLKTGGEGAGEEEKTSLAGIGPGVSADAFLEETVDLRREKALRSLSLTLPTDRWEMLQVVSQRATRSRRLAVHALQTVFRMLHMAFGLSLMLVIMTFNAWFLICVVGGAGLGYLIFSSDLHALYGNYAEVYVARKIADERAKRARLSQNTHWPKKSWKTRLVKDKEKETTI